VGLVHSPSVHRIGFRCAGTRKSPWSGFLYRDRGNLYSTFTVQENSE
jgi:hypothetical protein